MPYQEKQIEKLYYSIGEVAELFNKPVHTIRFWENQFDILKPKKNKKGNRLFTPKDIENLKLIVHLLKDKDYTIEGVKKYLKENKGNNNQPIIAKLQELKKFLLEIRNEL
mgnify:CR=1 FL=1